MSKRVEQRMNEGEKPKLKLMIVDDNQDLVYSLETLFKMEGYDVITADNGFSCLQELEKGFQGIIILDMMMPVMDGTETLKKMVLEGFIKENVVLVLTAKKIQGEEFNEIYPYIHDYIQKPFDIVELVKVVKKIAEEWITKKMK